MTTWPTPANLFEKLRAVFEFAVGQPAAARTADPGGPPAPAGVNFAALPARPATDVGDAEASSSPVAELPSGTSGLDGSTLATGRGYVPPFFRHPDPFRDDQHHGSPDLELFPPSVVELSLAMDVLDGGDDADPEELWRVCQSMPRLHAVKQAARKVRSSEATLAKLT